MAQLIYTAIVSLDGYVADERGRFDWAEPDADVHRFVSEQAADKVVYSTTLERVSTANTRLERDFDPDAVAKLKAE